MVDHTTVIYCIIDDLLKALGHREDTRRIMSDAQVMTTAIVAARDFGSNIEHFWREKPMTRVALNSCCLSCLNPAPSLWTLITQIMLSRMRPENSML